MIVVKKILPFFFYFLASSALAQSGNVIHKTFTKQDGLDLDVIHTVAFDDDGFLWLGGAQLEVRDIILSDEKISLHRFNGVSFHQIPFPEGDPRILSVHELYKRDDGQFYVSTRTPEGDALFLFNPYTTQFIQVVLPSSNTFDVAISKVFRYKDKDYILTQLHREITLNILNEDVTLTPLFSFTSKENKFRLDESTRFIPYEDQLIIGDDNFAIVFLDWKGNVLKRFSEDTFLRDRDSTVDKFWLDEIFEANEKKYAFVNGREQLHEVLDSDKDIVPVEGDGFHLPSEVLKAYNDPSGNHIIANKNKGPLKFYAKGKDGFVQLFESDAFENTSSVELISNDLTKDVWVTSNWGELHYFKFREQKIKTFLPDKQLRTLASLGEDKYMVATESKGWFVLDLNSGTTEPFILRENDRVFSPTSSRTMMQEGDFIWSTSFGNILKVNAQNGETISYRHYPVNSMVAPTDSTFIYATNGYHLMEFNKNTTKHNKLVLTDTLKMFDLEFRDEGSVVVGTSNGVLIYDLQTKKAKLLNDTTQLEDPYILMMDYHPDYGYLLGTRAGHLVAFNLQSETFNTLYKDDLKAGIATVLFEGDTWWINTFNGIVAYNMNDKSKVRFSENDGLSNKEANRYSALDTGDGFLVGCIAGLNYFKPSELKPDVSHSELRLLKVRNYDKEQRKIIDRLDREYLDEQSQIVLPTEYKELQVDFALTHNVENRDHSFRYRMDDQDWVDLKQEQSIRFPNLGAGTYRLEIEALNYSGKKMGESLVLSINSKNFFYKTWWFYLLITVGGIGLAFYFLKQSQDKRRLQEDFSEGLLLSQENERTRIAKELHDSVGQQLTLIKRRAQDLSQDEISNMTHSALEEIRSISRGLYPAVLKQLGLSESIEQLLYDLDEQTELFCTSEIDDIDRYFSEEDSLNFYRFIQENISNILKHAEATSLVVMVKDQGKKVWVRIKDDGKGFTVTEEMKNNSLGLKTLSERIRILKGTLQINSKTGGGTEVVAEIPIS
ncbi:histidine kinase [Aureisphaera galaxeae]|uniref:sensor histidine kinase n=1 Tax=Aureisphaera galaxeae TaxID=1538023 RepID=UPI00234FBFFE|nr:sensor histidine kinase [Aureisphaera galaxeae]MDC8002660.1 histidine kinase [Aureisphaera galaxeae]